MTKLSALLVVLSGALAAVALFVLRRIPARPGSRFGAILASCMLWLLSCGRPPPPPAAGPGPPDGAAQAKGAAAADGAPTAKGGAAPASSAALARDPAWIEFRAAWQKIPTLKLEGDRDLDAVVEAKRKEARRLLAPLVAAGLIEKDAGDVLAEVYGDRVFHRLRAMWATCYDPTELGWVVQMSREHLEKRLDLLGKLEREGKLRPDVIATTSASIARDWEAVLRVEAHWRAATGKARDAKLQKEEQELVGLFVRDQEGRARDDVAVRPGLQKAMALVRLLYQP